MFGKYRIIVSAVLILVLILFGLILFAENSKNHIPVKESYRKNLELKKHEHSKE